MFYLLLLSLAIDIHSFDLKVPVDQQSTKNNMVFSNGKTYQNLEDELCTKFANLPEFIIICGYGLGTDDFENKIVNPAYCPNYCHLSYTVFNPKTGIKEEKEKNGNCFLIPEKIVELDYEEACFILLHEIGHSIFPNKVPMTNISIACISIFGGKSFLMTIIGSYLSVLEEQRADDFAIKHSSLATLQGGLNYFKKVKVVFKKEYIKYKSSSFYLFNTVWGFLNFTHPNINKRIEKIKSALKNHFGVDS